MTWDAILMFTPLIILIFSIGFFVLFIWALVDILKSEFTGYNKIIWVLLVLFIPVLGTILYFIIGRKQKVQNYRD